MNSIFSFCSMLNRKYKSATQRELNRITIVGYRNPFTTHNSPLTISHSFSWENSAYDAWVAFLREPYHPNGLLRTVLQLQVLLLFFPFHQNPGFHQILPLLQPGAQPNLPQWQR